MIWKDTRYIIQVAIMGSRIILYEQAVNVGWRVGVVVSQKVTGYRSIELNHNQMVYISQNPLGSTTHKM